MIHQTAIIDPDAEIVDDVVVGPYTIIGKDVKIGRGTIIGAHVVIDQNVEIGEYCQIFPFACIGTPPQDVKYKGEKTGVKIGDRNVIREFVTIHRASVGGSGLTVIGDDNYLMAYVHIAHDCQLGNHTIFANAATLGGHVKVGDGVVIGGVTAVHQFSSIGSYSMIGGCSGVAQDVPPYVVAVGNRAKLYGLNVIGLKRHGFSEDTIKQLKHVYRTVFQSKLPLKTALKEAREEFSDSYEVNYFLEFIESSQRGVCR
ncbi:MAG: acyl-ACP--UDP-N-acetylglucosamine O-acyltransferase [Nitrospirota bacterium]